MRHSYRYRRNPRRSFSLEVRKIKNGYLLESEGRDDLFCKTAKEVNKEITKVLTKMK